MVTILKRQMISAGAIVVLLVTAGTAVADDKAAANNKRGFAVNAGVGASWIRDTDGAEKFDGNAFGYSIGVEYRFGPNFALGTGIFGLGTADDDFNGTNTEIEVKGADIKMRVIMPVGDSVEFFGQIGSAWYTADLEPGGSNFLGDTAAEFGLGLDIGSGDMAFRLSGIYLDGPRNESGALVTAGFNYRF